MCRWSSGLPTTCWGACPPSVQVDDLIQAGVMGLLEAARKYDAGQGASFETYAGIRIRGAMLDEVRRSDWTPRSVHRNARRVSEAVRHVEHRDRARGAAPGGGRWSWAWIWTSTSAW
jgi:RNA polymerase sigma factor FliA